MATEPIQGAVGCGQAETDTSPCPECEHYEVHCGPGQTMTCSNCGQNGEQDGWPSPAPTAVPRTAPSTKLNTDPREEWSCPRS